MATDKQTQNVAECLDTAGENRIPKPCPFCGRKAVWLKHIDDGTVKGIWMVECPECECTGPKADNQNEAICGWSMRKNGIPTTLAPCADGMWRAG